jgi:hypothetical protein
MKCDNVKCKDYQENRYSNCSWLNGRIGVQRCIIRKNPKAHPCDFCGRPHTAKSIVIKTKFGNMCQYCRGSKTRYTNLALDLMNRGIIE